MTLMEEIYLKLKKEQLVEGTEDYSVNWCERSKSWYCVQRGSGSDLTISTAIACWRKVIAKYALAILRRKRFGGIVDGEIEVLSDIRDQLEDYLASQFGVEGISLPSSGFAKC